MTPITLLMVAGGLILLFLGGELMLRSAVGLARRFGISPLLIGLTVVAAATSMPELVVTETAGLEGVPDVGIGNVIGSNIANILLILGVTALIAPVATRPHVVARDGGAVFVATAVFIGFAFLGPIGRLHGALMLLLLISYVCLSYLHERRLMPRLATASSELEAKSSSGDSQPQSLLVAFGFLAGGLACLIIGSKLLVDGAVEIALALGVSQSVIGLTLVAFGTSVPELATAIVAALRGHTQVALGNVLGSNIFNLLLILGVLVLTVPVQVAPEVLGFDIWILAAVTIGILPVMYSGWRIGRLEGALFLLLYAVYIWVQFVDSAAGA